MNIGFCAVVEGTENSNVDVATITSCCTSNSLVVRPNFHSSLKTRKQAWVESRKLFWSPRTASIHTLMSENIPTENCEKLQVRYVLLSLKTQTRRPPLAHTSLIHSRGTPAIVVLLPSRSTRTHYLPVEARLATPAAQTTARHIHTRNWTAALYLGSMIRLSSMRPAATSVLSNTCSAIICASKGFDVLITCSLVIRGCLCAWTARDGGEVAEPGNK